MPIPMNTVRTAKTDRVHRRPLSILVYVLASGVFLLLSIEFLLIDVRKPPVYVGRPWYTFLSVSAAVGDMLVSVSALLAWVKSRHGESTCMLQVATTCLLASFLTFCVVLGSVALKWPTVQFGQDLFGHVNLGIVGTLLFLGLGLLAHQRPASKGAK